MRARTCRFAFWSQFIGALLVGAPIFGVLARAQTPIAKTAVSSPSIPKWQPQAPKLAKQLIGHCVGVTQLEVSPDGKWLLSWDGISKREKKNPIGPRWVWNLATGKARSLRRWSDEIALDHQEIGWTPDGRIWSLQRPSQLEIETKTPFAPRIFLQKPDGSGKIECYDPPRAGEMADRENGAIDAQFSRDGREIWVASRFGFRSFDGKTGKLRARRARPLRGEFSGPLSLSRDGKQLLAREKWKVFDARNGRLLLSIAHQNGETLLGFWEEGHYFKAKSGFVRFCRLSDDREIWKLPQSSRWLRGGPNLAVAGEKTIAQFDKLSGQIRQNLPKMAGNWSTMAISPDAKWIYAVNAAGQIYRWRTG